MIARLQVLSEYPSAFHATHRRASTEVYNGPTGSIGGGRAVQGL